MLNTFKKLAGDRKGATAIEYGLIAAFIALALAAGAQNIGPKLKSTFTKVDTDLGAANTAVGAN